MLKSINSLRIIDIITVIIISTVILFGIMVMTKPSQYNGDLNIGDSLHFQYGWDDDNPFDLRQNCDTAVIIDIQDGYIKYKKLSRWERNYSDDETYFRQHVRAFK